MLIKFDICIIEILKIYVFNLQRKEWIWWNYFTVYQLNEGKDLIEKDWS